MKGIKKKFLDILFENDKDYIPEKEEDEVKVRPAAKKKPENTAKAKEVLYRKSKNSAFIDLDETISPVKQEKETRNEYELSSQISPIFGVVDEKKKTAIVRQNIDETMTNKPEDSHLDIITSPIYGYGEQDESNYLPSETNTFASEEDLQLPFDETKKENENDEFQDLMDYVDQDDSTDNVEEYEDGQEYPDEEEYEEDQEYPEDEETYGEIHEYPEVQETEDYHKDEETTELQEQEQESREIPYYDENVFSDDYDVEDVNLFDVEEDE